jgi:hypothetical protein
MCTRACSSNLALLGIDPRLQQLAAKVDPRRMYILSRDEIARFGVVPGERFETPWMSFADRNKQRFAIKAVTRAMEGSEHRRVLAHFRCVRGRIFFAYEREVPSGESGYAVLVRVVVGDSDLMLARWPQRCRPRRCRSLPCRRCRNPRRPSLA